MGMFWFPLGGFFGSPDFTPAYFIRRSAEILELDVRFANISTQSSPLAARGASSGQHKREEAKRPWFKVPIANT
jgi:hypothetical protein